MRFHLPRTARRGVTAIADMVASIAVLHYITSLHSVLLHEVFQRLYYLPVVTAAVLDGRTDQVGSRGNARRFRPIRMSGSPPQCGTAVALGATMRFGEVRHIDARAARGRGQRFARGRPSYLASIEGMTVMNRSIIVAAVVLAAVGVPAMAAAQTLPPTASRTIAAAEAAGSPGTSLDTLVQELERHNPELQSARREVDVRVARIAPAGAPPDPTVSVGYMSGFGSVPFFPSASTPNAFRQVSVTQEIPYPGKLALRSRVAATEADAERWNLESTRRRLVSELKMAYFDYALAERSTAVVLRNKTLLEQMRQIAESDFAVGKGSQQDVLKAQVEISLLLERLAVLDQQRATAQARINALLYRSPDAPLGPVGEYAPAAMPQSLDALKQLTTQNSAGLKEQDQMITRGQQALALANRELRPDFGVTVTTQKYTGDMPWMYGLEFMVKVPLFWQRKQRPMIAEAAASLASAESLRDNTLAADQGQVAQDYLAATTSQRLANLYSDTILPQARLTLESSLAAYRVGRVDFLTLLSNYQTVLTYEISYEEQSARLRQALARLEPLVGTEFVH